MTAPTPLGALAAVPANAPLQDPSVAALFTGLLGSLNAWSQRVATLINNFMTGQLPGTTTNDSATAGNVGQYISSDIVAPGSGISNALQTNITSISLTAGDWDVEGVVVFIGAAGTVFNTVSCGISTTSVTLPAFEFRNQQQRPSSITADNVAITAPRQRISIASTTTVYLIGFVGFTVSTTNAYGQIQARRVR